MVLDLLYGSDAWIIQAIFLILTLSGVALGFRWGRNSAAKTDDGVKSQIPVVEGALIGVLGLLLAFTMSMAVTRYEARKQLVLEEANAIGTASLRTRLLPEPERTEIAARLRGYVDVRLQFVAAAENPEKLRAARDAGARLQNEIWTSAVAYGQKDPNPVKAGLLLQSLNQVIDVEAARWMAFYDHVPAAVIYLNQIVAILTMMMVGYAYGFGGRHHIFSMCLLAVAITVVLSVIVDLDRPRHGLIQVSQQPLIDLQHQLRAQILSAGY